MKVQTQSLNSPNQAGNGIDLFVKLPNLNKFNSKVSVRFYLIKNKAISKKIKLKKTTKKFF